MIKLDLLLDLNQEITINAFFLNDLMSQV